MKQFVIKAYDGEGKLDKRMEVRPRHFEGMEKMKEHILCAGGMLDDDGKMIGYTEEGCTHIQDASQVCCDDRVVQIK